MNSAVSSFGAALCQFTVASLPCACGRGCALLPLPRYMFCAARCCRRCYSDVPWRELLKPGCVPLIQWFVAQQLPERGKEGERKQYMARRVRREGNIAVKSDGGRGGEKRLYESQEGRRGREVGSREGGKEMV
ncbi:hypothetical protein E2C01_095989 [Portunus trituberculatus]|uniref:Secreted protein n=1 Tax=Portunus trituberculatus TaxID=210409 RepID=A0A5B7K1L5_PORTR|nr:hypothetical protein [Portunus trituberculatus]